MCTTMPGRVEGGDLLNKIEVMQLVYIIYDYKKWLVKLYLFCCQIQKVQHSKSLVITIRFPPTWVLFNCL